MPKIVGYRYWKCYPNSRNPNRQDIVIWVRHKTHFRHFQQNSDIESYYTGIYGYGDDNREAKMWDPPGIYQNKSIDRYYKYIFPRVKPLVEHTEKTKYPPYLGTFKKMGGKIYSIMLCCRTHEDRKFVIYPYNDDAYNSDPYNSDLVSEDYW